MKALTETKPSERISLASHLSQQRTVTRTARFRQKMRRWWPFYVMTLPGVIYFFIWHYLPIWETKSLLSNTGSFRPIFGSACNISRR